MLRSLALALALLAAAAPAATAHDEPPDAEIFATNNTALITDPDDPRLDARLNGFARRVMRIIDEGGGTPRGSELLDGVFFSSDLGGTTFERSRVFDVDHVTDGELHDIAETIRRRFLQQSVLTFDHLPKHDPDADAIELEVPGVTAQALRDGLLADAEARERLFGGSVTLDGHLLLVADRADTQLARTFAERIGGNLRRAETSYGEREFVEAATAGRARIERRTLVITGTAEDDTIALRGDRRLDIDFGDDGVVDFEVGQRRFDRIRVEGGEGFDRLVLEGREVHLTAAGPVRFDSLERVDVAATAAVTIDDLSGTGVQEVHVDAGDGGADRVVVNTSDEQEQTLVSGFGGTVFVLGPTFVQIDRAETTDRLRVNGRGGSDLLSTSTAAMQMTLDGGADSDTVLGGPGDDVLLGGTDFDDVAGGRGDDVASMGPDFDRFTWRPGDGSDVVNGQGGRDSMFFTGSADAEAFDLAADGRRLRFTRDVGSIAMDVDVEVIDSIALGGADVFTIGDLRETAVQEVNASLAPSFGTPSGDGAADRVAVTGTDGDDAVTVTGRTVFSGSVTVAGLPVKVGISHAEGALDTLAIATLGGDDTVDSSGLEPGTIQLAVD
jgi:hypothetical protein